MSDDFTEKLLGCSWAPMMGLKSNQCNEVWQMSVLLRTITLLAVQLHILTPSGPTWKNPAHTLVQSFLFFSGRLGPPHVELGPSAARVHKAKTQELWNWWDIAWKPGQFLISQKNLHFHRVHNWVYWYPVLTIEILKKKKKKWILHDQPITCHATTS